MQPRPVTCFLSVCLTTAAFQGAPAEKMVLIPGDVFEMGDVFDDGAAYASPVHEVTLSSFYLGRCEITIEEFAAFVDETGYLTSAEIEGKPPFENGMGPPAEPNDYSSRIAGRGTFIAAAAGDWSFDEAATWRHPSFEQGPRHPVTCVSWIDAASYCNWLSAKEDLPAAYDTATGELLDAEGRPTQDVGAARGYRLPTEAEWEFAARELGRPVRFGNGEDVARSAEINFDASNARLEYAETGEFRERTLPVASLPPNALGLYDMSGNVWEWCSDFVDPYTDEPQQNPYQSEGLMDLRRAARGGGWVIDASHTLAAARVGWVAYDRCNNVGFRIARSK